MATAADITTGQLHRCDFTNNAATNVLSATPADGWLADYNDPDPLTEDLAVTGYGDSTQAIRFDGTGPYGVFPAIVATGNVCTRLIVMRRNGHCESLDGIFFGRATHIAGLQVPANTVNRLGYAWNGTTANQWDSGIGLPLGEWGLAAMIVDDDVATIMWMDLSGEYVFAQNHIAHGSIEYAGNNRVAWDGETNGAHLAAIDVMSTAIYSRALTAVDLRAYLQSVVGTLPDSGAQVPLVAGDTTIGAKTISGEFSRVLCLGDSQTANQLMFFDEMLTGAGSGIMAGVPARNQSGWTNNASVTGLTATQQDTTLSGSGSGLNISRWSFNGSTTPSGAFTSRTPNSVDLLTIGQCKQICGHDPVARAKLNTHSMTVRVPIYRHPNGTTTPVAQIVLAEGSTQIAAGGLFHGYAATAGWVMETLQVPYSDLPDDWDTLTVHLCVGDSIATESGKFLYHSGCFVELTDTALTRGHVIYNVGASGQPAENWLLESFYTNAQMDLLAAADADVLVINQGTNTDTGAIDGTTHKTVMVDLIERLRNSQPNVPVILATQWARNASEGGEGGIDNYVSEGNYLTTQALTNIAMVNQQRLLPNYLVARGQYRETWEACPTTTRFNVGSLLQSSGSGKFYIAKLTHYKGANSAPASDTTNWHDTGLTVAALTGLQGFSNDRYTSAVWNNPLLGQDGIHCHPAGYRMAAQVFCDGLRMLAGLADSEVLTAVQGLEATIAALEVSPVNRDDEPPGDAFIFRVSRRSDGTYGTDRPLRIAPGTVEDIRIGLELSPVYGNKVNVSSVGTPVIDGGSLTVGTPGKFLTIATLTVSGTASAGESRTITTTVTMRNGDVLSVPQAVEVFSS